MNLAAVMKEFIILERQIVDLKNLMLITQDISWEAISKLIGTKLNFQDFLGVLKKFKHDCNIEVAKRLFSCYDKQEKGYLDDQDLKLMILPISLDTQNINQIGDIKIEVLSKIFKVILEVQLKQLKCLSHYKFNPELAFRFLSQGRLTVNQNHVKMFLKTHGIQCTNNELLEGDQCRFSHSTERLNQEGNGERIQLNRQNGSNHQTTKFAFRGKQNARQINDRNQFEEFQSNVYDKSNNNDQQYKLNITKQFDNLDNNYQTQNIEKSQQQNNYDQRRSSLNDFRGSQQREKNNVNSDRWERIQENKEDKQNEVRDFQNRTTGRGRGRGYLQQSAYKKDNVNQDRWNNRNEISRTQEFNNKMDNYDDQKNVQKRIKRNDVVIKKRAKILKLEQSLEMYEFVKVIGLYNQQLIILKANKIEFYNIPFKRNGIDILDESLKTNFDHMDKIFVNGWVCQKNDGSFNLTIEFLNKGEKIKNLLIYSNLFQQQSHLIINEVSLKKVVFVDYNQDLILTFCQDGLIRIFQLIQDQYKYIQHYNFEQTIETVIKVGSNYLIGTKNQKILLFDGQTIKKIEYQFNKLCTQMIVDYNRVILKMDNDNESSIYILTQNLQVIGPMYNGSKINSFGVIRSYENDKLFIFNVNNSIETFIEIDNVLYQFNKISNQSIQNIYKFEMTNENMLIQKYIIGNNGLDIKIFSIVPEE
ncbi:unnamed protein product [Paramecium pentaurelia]|uniref:EF-hand domain-containing protein n=1 Tax=Paramecium pentaurelia TaxID=43138 RepID=A0A8S1WJV7_9CILI|nr:unnamed protein product [Paramecium pentaurelia]